MIIISFLYYHVSPSIVRVGRPSVVLHYGLLFHQSLCIVQPYAIAQTPDNALVIAMIQTISLCPHKP